MTGAKFDHLPPGAGARGPFLPEPVEIITASPMRESVKLVTKGLRTDPLRDPSPSAAQLAQSLSALYPAGTDEKRWVDGVLARKKGLGFG